MKIVRPGDPDYDKDRVISNARFDCRPWAIYYCANARDVRQAITDARANGGGVRIRSGGHQHEGMCSANGVLLIDVSSIDSFQFEEGRPGRVWIGAGTALADVYVELWRRGYYFRHKISSGFVRRQVNPNLVPALTNVIRKTAPEPPELARQYVSLHCLGGAAFDERLPSAYAFRDRGVLLQYQAWWQPDAARLDKRCIAWIENFRKTMAPYTDGAFINFVDRDIPLAEYYKDKLPQVLVPVKQQWDPEDFFKFEMSIPLHFPHGNEKEAVASPRIWSLGTVPPARAPVFTAATKKT